MVRDPNTKTVAGHHPDELADCHRVAETAIPAAPAWPLATDSVPAAESHQAGDDADKARTEMAALPGRLEATGSAPTPQNEGRTELPATASTDSAEVLPVVIPVEAEQKLAWWQRISLILIALLIGTVLGIARSLNPYDENGQPRRWGDASAVRIATVQLSAIDRLAMSELRVDHELQPAHAWRLASCSGCQPGRPGDGIASRHHGRLVRGRWDKRPNARTS
jgi:hypothetical protein